MQHNQSQRKNVSQRHCSDGETIRYEAVLYCGANGEEKLEILLPTDQKKGILWLHNDMEVHRKNKIPSLQSLQQK